MAALLKFVGDIWIFLVQITNPVSLLIVAVTAGVLTGYAVTKRGFVDAIINKTTMRQALASLFAIPFGFALLTLSIVWYLSRNYAPGSIFVALSLMLAVNSVSVFRDTYKEYTDYRRPKIKNWS